MKTISQRQLCGVVPPHILRHVAEHGDDKARETVASTLQHSGVIASHRHTAAAGPAAAKANGRKSRKVYDAQHGSALPGRLVLTERKTSSTDREAVEAFDGSGVTFDFFRTVFERDSIDGRGLPLISSVHYGAGFDNALWDGQQMIYGDGDGRLFRRFTCALDVIGHELTHGVTQYTAALDYVGESGALNEHFSDAFGMMIKQYALGQTAQDSDWIIGAGLFTKRVNGVGIRSMKAPGTAYDDPVLGRDPQPAHMSQYVDTEDDNFGVHINSGIPNHAFYLAATAIGGHTWTVLGPIWYEVLRRGLGSSAQFADMVRETVLTAGALFGGGSGVQKAVAEAWRSVGLPVNVPAASRRPPAGGKWRRRPAASDNRTAKERNN